MMIFCLIVQRILEMSLIMIQTLVVLYPSIQNDRIHWTAGSWFCSENGMNISSQKPAEPTAFSYKRNWGLKGRGFPNDRNRLK